MSAFYFSIDHPSISSVHHLHLTASSNRIARRADTGATTAEVFGSGGGGIAKAARNNGTRHDKFAGAARNELQSIASQKSNLELLLQASQEKEKSLQEQLEVGRKDQQAQQSTLQRQLQESQELVAGVRAESSGRLEELKRLRPELKEAQEQITTVRQELKSTQDTVSSCKDEIQRIETKPQVCHQTRDNIKQQSADNCHYYELTLKDLALAREKAAELGAKNQDVEKDLMEAKSDCNDATINVMFLKGKLKISEIQTDRSNKRNEALVTECNAAQTDLSNWQKALLYGYQPSAPSGPLVSRWLKEVSGSSKMQTTLFPTPFACCVFTSALLLPESLGLATITTLGQLIVTPGDYLRPEVLPLLQGVVQTYAHRTKQALSDGQSAFVLRTIELLCLTLESRDRPGFVEPALNAVLPYLSLVTVLNKALLFCIQDGCSKREFSLGISLRDAAFRASEDAPDFDMTPHTRVVVNGSMEELLVIEMEEGVEGVAHIEILPLDALRYHVRDAGFHLSIRGYTYI
ncbi:hypothetical protein LTS15_008910 [Exophiala xenobiotica]|nr:hypothetical protein LTS15_008910 [Exophiala xenobiotica]